MMQIGQQHGVPVRGITVYAISLIHHTAFSFCFLILLKAFRGFIRAMLHFSLEKK
jgi:hypothetical protein